MKYIALIVAFLLGVFIFLKPDALWMFERTFITQGGEPTEEYLSMTRMVGFVISVIAVLIAIF